MDAKGMPDAISLIPQTGPRGHSSNGTAGKRRPVRRDPEKRRQQNIQAQKKYREKLKRRLDQLETLAASVGESMEVVVGATSGAGTPNSSVIEHQSSCRYIGQVFDELSFEPVVDFTLPTSITPASSTDIALWNSTTSTDLSHYVADEDTTGQYWAGYVDCGCFMPHVQFSSTMPRDYRDLKVNSVPCLSSSDAYTDTIRVERLCIVEAIMANCLHIGLTEEMFCADDAVSPFYRPGRKTTDSSGSDTVVRAVQSIFTTLKPDLRPIHEQITTLHHPIIDVLPFPTFRKNLIQNLDVIDDEELHHDLLNGLVCWRGAGVSTHTPWDSRSWEARPWFLQKYWALLGGEEGELVRQSEWWRNMRGDKSDPWSGLTCPSYHQD